MSLSYYKYICTGTVFSEVKEQGSQGGALYSVNCSDRFVYYRSEMLNSHSNNRKKNINLTASALFAK
ncbi:hypothetical protein CHISP_1544 [Chitinispirillum alkaliphilum]|nr:hypothetical protein CHISP_1544 [Chitinispirillum alkaliphilum]